jgi:hypothetical protein
MMTNILAAEIQIYESTRNYKRRTFHFVNFGPKAVISEPLSDGTWRNTQDYELDASYSSESDRAIHNRKVWDLFLSRLRKVVDDKETKRVWDITKKQAPAEKIIVKETAEPGEKEPVVL